MNNTLQLVGPRQDLAITPCLEKVQTFCQIDAYRGYDLVGVRYEGEPNVIQREILRAVNGPMRARSKVAAWSSLLDQTIQELAEIPTDVDLVDATDEEYAGVREKVRACFRRITAERWITDMAASKVLHLKRPRLIAISDSYIREALATPAPNLKDYPWRADYCARRAISVMDAVRSVGRANQDTLSNLQRQLQEQRQPIELSKARIVDILVWVDMAIGPHQIWTPLAAQQQWSDLRSRLRAL